MAKMIALLRSINVGGRFVKMEKLRALFEERGYLCVRTYIQSGNVLFETARDVPATALEAELEAMLGAALGFEVSVLLVTPEELRGILAANPFTGALAEGERKHITILRTVSSAEALERLRPNEASTDEYSVEGRVVYLLCRNGYGNTLYTNSFFERKLKIAATTRNIETLEALAGMI